MDSIHKFIDTSRHFSGSAGDYPKRTYVIYGVGDSPPINVSRVSPVSGAIEGGYEASVFGNGLPEDLEVYFGDSRALILSLPSTSEVVVTVPPGARLGPVDVEVHHGGQVKKLVTGFEYTRRFPSFDLSRPSEHVTAVQEEEPSGLFAYSVASGDLNGDGLSDVAFASSLPGQEQAVITVISGQKKPPPSIPLSEVPLAGRGFLLTGGPLTGSADIDLAVSADVNGDGLGDLVIGVSPRDAFILFGRQEYPGVLSLEEGLSQGLMVKITDSQLDLQGQVPLGFKVSGAGDLDGDGLSEVAVGVPNEAFFGAVYVIRGRQEWETVFDLAAASPGVLKISRISGARIGVDLCNLGDVNEDGLPDLGVGTFIERFSHGREYIVFGRQDLRREENVEGIVEGGGTVEVMFLTGLETYYYCRTRGAGDFNGDGLKDVLFSVYGGGEERSGECCLLFGKPDLPNVLYFPADVAGRGTIIQGEIPEDLAVAGGSVGDFDGDGLDDLVIGAPGVHDLFNGGSPGKAFVLLGRRDPLGEISLGRLGDHGFKINGIVPAGQARYEVAGAGDFNGDGLGDIVLGERGFLSSNTTGNGCSSDSAAHAAHAHGTVT